MKAPQLVILLLITAAFSTNAYSQYYYYNDRYYDNDFTVEIGAGVGAMNCITDVGGANTEKTFYLNEIRLKNTKVCNSLHAGFMYQNLIGARLEATWGSIQSYDSDIKGQSLNQVTKYLRNLNFRSNISEVALLAEFHPLMLLDYKESAPLVSPYVVAGLGYFSFNPKTEYKGQIIDLPALHTEGEGFPETNVKPYSLSQMNVPLGLGLRYEISAVFNLRAEFLHRVLFTDYLDDVSSRKVIDPSLFDKYLPLREAAYAKVLYNPSLDGKAPPRRGNPNNRDSYMSISLKLGIVLGRERLR